MLTFFFSSFSGYRARTGSVTAARRTTRARCICRAAARRTATSTATRPRTTGAAWRPRRRGRSSLWRRGRCRRGIMSTAGAAGRRPGCCSGARRGEVAGSGALRNSMTTEGRAPAVGCSGSRAARPRRATRPRAQTWPRAWDLGRVRAPLWAAPPVVAPAAAATGEASGGGGSPRGVPAGPTGACGWTCEGLLYDGLSLLGPIEWREGGELANYWQCTGKRSKKKKKEETKKTGHEGMSMETRLDRSIVNCTNCSLFTRLKDIQSYLFCI